LRFIFGIVVGIVSSIISGIEPSDLISLGEDDSHPDSFSAKREVIWMR